MLIAKQGHLEKGHLYRRISDKTPIYLSKNELGQWVEQGLGGSMIDSTTKERYVVPVDPTTLTDEKEVRFAESKLGKVAQS